MRILPERFIAVFALVLIAGNGQCVASCSFENCKEVSGSQTNRQNNIPRCPGHRAPAKQASDLCSAVVIAEVGQSPMSKFSTANDPAPFATVLIAASGTPVSSPFADKGSPLGSSPPKQASLSLTVLRI
jgi:hypothetical protein